MRVFLSGKVDDAAGFWRDAILTQEWGPHGTGSVYEARTPWILYDTTAPYEYDYPEERSTPAWPVRERAVLGLHDYVGPYRTLNQGSLKSAAIFHGMEGYGQHGQREGTWHHHVLAECRRAIASADIVFAFINTADAYGTLAEIGYAAALGKFVSVWERPGAGFGETDFWFAAGLANHRGVVGRWDADEYETRPYPEEAEGRAVAEALKDAFVAYAAWEKPRAVTPVTVIQPDANTRLWSELLASYQQIVRWSADPRVRAEAARVLNRLGSAS